MSARASLFLKGQERKTGEGKVGLGGRVRQYFSKGEKHETPSTGKNVI